MIFFRLTNLLTVAILELYVENGFLMPLLKPGYSRLRNSIYHIFHDELRGSYSHIDWKKDSKVKLGSSKDDVYCQYREKPSGKHSASSTNVPYVISIIAYGIETSKITLHNLEKFLEQFCADRKTVFEHDGKKEDPYLYKDMFQFKMRLDAKDSCIRSSALNLRQLVDTICVGAPLETYESDSTKVSLGNIVLKHYFSRN